MKFTKDQFEALKELMEIVIDESMTKRLGLAEGESLIDKLNHLPTKDEFYKEMDKIYKELETVREEQAIITGRVYDNEDRISKIEKKLTFS